MSSDAAALPSSLEAVGRRLRRAHELVGSLSPRKALAALIVVQWLAVAALALTVKHNGWLYYAGGDQLWHYTGAYLLAHGHLPATFVGYGWSILLLPVAAVAGPNLASALPAIVLFNTVVLLPVALLCVYAIAARIAGRIFGYFAAALWIALPYLGILFVEQGYHQKYTELTLPQVLGLASVPDFPAMVALLVSAYFCLRALEVAGWMTPVAAGLAAGYSIAIKPSNSIFLVAPLLLFLVEKRRALLTFAAGLAPALLTLAIWKYRGLGELAAAPAQEVRLASGVGGLLDRIHNPQLNSYAHFRIVLQSLREHFWVARVMEWLPVAGTIALLARSRSAFLLVGGWFAIFVVAKATLRSGVGRGRELLAHPDALVPGLPPAHGFGRAARPGRASASGAGVLHADRTSGDDRPRRGGRGLRRPAARSDRCDAGAEGRRPPGGHLRRQPAAGVLRRQAPGKYCERRRAPVVARAEAKGNRRLLPGAAGEELDRCALRRNTGGRPVPALHGACRGNEGRLVRRSARPGDVDVPHRRVGELARRPAPRRRLRAEPACHRDGSVVPSRNCCSSSASRCARIVF